MQMQMCCNANALQCNALGKSMSMGANHVAKSTAEMTRPLFRHSEIKAQPRAGAVDMNLILSGQPWLINLQTIQLYNCDRNVAFANPTTSMTMYVYSEVVKAPAGVGLARKVIHILRMWHKRISEAKQLI